MLNVKKMMILGGVTISLITLMFSPNVALASNVTNLADGITIRKPGGGGFVRGRTDGFDHVKAYKKGVTAYHSGEYSQAVRFFKRVLKVARSDASTNQNLAMSYVKLGQYKEAGRYFSKAVRYDDNRIGLYAKSATAYMVAGETKKAQDILAILDKRVVKCGNCADKAELTKARSDIESAFASIVRHK